MLLVFFVDQGIGLPVFEKDWSKDFEVLFEDVMEVVKVRNAVQHRLFQVVVSPLGVLQALLLRIDCSQLQARQAVATLCTFLEIF